VASEDLVVLCERREKQKGDGEMNVDAYAYVRGREKIRRDEPRCGPTCHVGRGRGKR
jgi:hypothetical protein